MAIRATALLFPLLGTTNILFCVEPSSGVIYKLVYRVVNALLQSSQVLLVYVQAYTPISGLVLKTEVGDARNSVA